MKKIIRLFAIISLVIAGLSCRTIEKTVYEDRYITKYQSDTLRMYDRDSIFLERYTKGDTVFSNKYIEKWKFKNKIVEKIDTVMVDKVEEVHTVKEVVPSWCWWILGIFSLQIAGFLLYLYIKFKPLL